MALADYYERAAVAASQIIAGFDTGLFRRALEEATVGLAVSTEAAASQEGNALADLTVRLLARLYPCLDLRVDNSGEAQRLEALARTINPRIEFNRHASLGIGVGPVRSDFKTTYFAGSDGWDAILSTSGPVELGSSPNPLGAGAAACLAVGSIFNHLLLSNSEPRPANDFRFSTFYGDKVQTPATTMNDSWQLPSDAVLVGVGAIGNAAVWALGRSPLSGSIHIVDKEAIELSNLQRYVLAERVDEGRPKVNVAAGHFNAPLICIPHQVPWAEFVQKFGYRWLQVLVALDTAADRRSIQAALPEWTANAWTQPGDLGVSVHSPFDSDGACLSCLYLPKGKTLNDDELVAAALGVPERVMEVRTLLHNGAAVERPLLEAVAHGLHLPVEEVLSYEGRSIRELYVQGVCGGGLIPLGTIGLPRQELHVPLAHQSALAGVLLAAALVRRALGTVPETTTVTRIDVTAPLGEFLTQPILKAGTGLCICEDPDYLDAYRKKFRAS